MTEADENEKARAYRRFILECESDKGAISFPQLDHREDCWRLSPSKSET
jgi:hypothetical protein